MKIATLKYDEEQITFENFEQVKYSEAVTVKIFGQDRRVVVSIGLPETEALACHNIIRVVNNKCYNPDLIKKLQDAGILSGARFFVSDNAYYPMMD